MLTFQRLDVYQRAIEFLALVYEVIGDLPKGQAERADQLARAAESVKVHDYVQVDHHSIKQAPRVSWRTPRSYKAMQHGPIPWRGTSAGRASQ
jgi:hypothetical protein